MPEGGLGGARRSGAEPHQGVLRGDGAAIDGTPG